MRDRDLYHQKPVVTLEIERHVQITDPIHNIALGDFNRCGVSLGDEIALQQHYEPELGWALR